MFLCFSLWQAIASDWLHQVRQWPLAGDNLHFSRDIHEELVDSWSALQQIFGGMKEFGFLVLVSVFIVRLAFRYRRKAK